MPLLIKEIRRSILYIGLLSGVTEVIYMSYKYKDKPKYQIAEDILKKANVKFRLVSQNNFNIIIFFRQHVPKVKTIGLTIESP